MYRWLAAGRRGEQAAVALVRQTRAAKVAKTLANPGARMQPVPLIRIWVRARRGSTAFLHMRLED